MADDRTARRIRSAAEDGHLVRVVGKKSWDGLQGSIVRLGPKWLLTAIEDSAGFNGHALIRRSDARFVGTYPTARFAQRALAAEGHWPSLGSTGSN